MKKTKPLSNQLAPVQRLAGRVGDRVMHIHVYNSKGARGGAPLVTRLPNLSAPARSNVLPDQTVYV